MKKSLITLAIASVSLPLYADSGAHNSSKSTQPLLEEMQVMGVRQRLIKAGMLKDSIQKTEVLNAGAIEAKQAASLTEAIADAPGVRVSNDCSMCGVKRVMLNGLKGEHTNVLIDGIPSHTMLSGFYGLDAAASAGVDSIEIARGAGASLIAPEAIGGTLNIVSKNPSETGLELDLSDGENHYQKYSGVASYVSDSGATRATLVGQYDNRDEFDADNNGVSENPKLENQSITARISHDFGANDNVVFRASHIDSEIFGGPVDSSKDYDIDKVLREFSADSSQSEQLFVDDNVNNDYIGKAWETTEWIESTRDEFYLTWLHEVNEDFNFTLTGSHNSHDQDSFYEGIDYQADDVMVYLDARANLVLTENHLLTFGADSRSEEMRSHSNALVNVEAYVSDSFDYDTRGIYLQDTWTASDNLEVAMAVRIDQVKADFVDPSKPGTEIDQTIVSPRVDMRYLHSDAWTSRLSFGQGYRAPLSFFETDHGILDAEKGYLIEVDELERSESITYALSYDWEALTATWSIAHTSVENLAGLEETDAGVPVLTQADDKAKALATDIVVGWQATDELNLNISAELVDYNDSFKNSFAVAPIERRITVGGDYDINGWDIVLSATWVDGRDLNDYNYEGWNDASLTEKKSTDAPSYFTVDMKVAKEITEELTLYVGATNLLDYTQAGNEDSPLFYDASGSYDVAYIYGPLRGREAYAGLKYNF